MLQIIAVCKRVPLRIAGVQDFGFDETIHILDDLVGSCLARSSILHFRAAAQ